MLNQHNAAAMLAKARPVSRLKLRTFTLQRAGVSDFVVMGDLHCGPKAELVGAPGGKRAIPVRWNVIVTCEPVLDDRGFLFDQASVGLWMDRVATLGTSLSCEALTRAVAERLLAKIERDVPTCKITRLELEFSPKPYAASLSVVYE